LGDKTIEKDYVLTWMLLAIANSPLRERLAFKGGTALKKAFVPDYRFSEDLDFTLLDNITDEELNGEVEALFPWLSSEVNITMDVRRIETHQTASVALYLNYVGPLRGDLTSRFLKTDFTRNEVLLFPLVESPLQSPYSDCQERTETLQVYSLEEILAEKLCALLGRTEPRDLYDVHYLLTNRLADAETVSYHLSEKMARHNLDTEGLSGVLLRKQDVFKRLWELRLGGQMVDLQPVDAVIRETRRCLRQSGLVERER
jgi:predicted nucleotidyltransferase component of viral defense system